MQPGTERVLFLLLETDEWFSLAVCSGNYWGSQCFSYDLSGAGDFGRAQCKQPAAISEFINFIIEAKKLPLSLKNTSRGLSGLLLATVSSASELMAELHFEQKLLLCLIGSLALIEACKTGVVLHSQAFEIFYFLFRSKWSCHIGICSPSTSSSPHREVWYLSCV